MKQTVDLCDFRQAFRDYGRADNFSYAGLELLFDWLEEADPDMELDVIGLCCNYSEEDEDDIRDNYQIDEDVAVMEYLEENTIVVGRVSGKNDIVYQVF